MNFFDCQVFVDTVPMSEDPASFPTRFAVVSRMIPHPSLTHMERVAHFATLDFLALSMNFSDEAMERYENWKNQWLGEN